MSGLADFRSAQDPTCTSSAITTYTRYSYVDLFLDDTLEKYNTQPARTIGWNWYPLLPKRIILTRRIWGSNESNEIQNKKLLKSAFFRSISSSGFPWVFYSPGSVWFRIYWVLSGYRFFIHHSAGCSLEIKDYLEYTEKELERGKRYLEREGWNITQGI